jgi:LytS/YehU family sensor histidine kinase
METDIPKEINIGRQIPKMMIQAHVENAIKHGLSDSRKAATDESGTPGQTARADRILVKIRETDNTLMIIIEDNGVGRGNSTVPQEESTGVGMMSLARIMDSVRQLYGIRIRQEVEDLYSAGGKPAGTRVTIHIG